MAYQRQRVRGWRLFKSQRVSKWLREAKQLAKQLLEEIWNDLFAVGAGVIAGVLVVSIPVMLNFSDCLVCYWLGGVVLISSLSLLRDSRLQESFSSCSPESVRSFIAGVEKSSHIVYQDVRNRFKSIVASPNTLKGSLTGSLPVDVLWYVMHEFLESKDWAALEMATSSAAHRVDLIIVMKSLWTPDVTDFETLKWTVKRRIRTRFLYVDKIKEREIKCLVNPYSGYDEAKRHFFGDLSSIEFNFEPLVSAKRQLLLAVAQHSRHLEEFVGSHDSPIDVPELLTLLDKQASLKTLTISHIKATPELLKSLAGHGNMTTIDIRYSLLSPLHLYMLVEICLNNPIKRVCLADDCYSDYFHYENNELGLQGISLHMLIKEPLKKPWKLTEVSVSSCVVKGESLNWLCMAAVPALKNLLIVGSTLSIEAIDFASVLRWRGVSVYRE